MKWWQENKIRMIQNNIRDIDSGINVDQHIEWLKRFHVNTLQIGCGGITAFHPSRLDCQRVSPYMKGDFFGEVLEKCHKNGIRVIARFDFSKTHEDFYEKHPDWYFKDAVGKPIRYHDTVATCLNGAYQQKCSFDILREVLTQYPVDGIFFNMFGYINYDYSGNYIGLCHCENCKRRFREMYDLELPVAEDPKDPVYQMYQEFKQKTVDDILARIHAFVQELNPDCAVSTYSSCEGVDIVRNESNSALERPLPFWIYSSSDNVGEITGTYGNSKISSNCCINAVDLPYRFMGVDDQLNQIRLYENMAAGGGLDWCIIGNFEEYPDKENFASVQKIFAFHRTYENYFGHFKSAARVMLVKDAERVWLQGNNEYRGIFRMLKEEHLPFDIIRSDRLEEHLNHLDQYDFIILPGTRKLSENVITALTKTKAAVVATGLALEDHPEQVSKVFATKLGEKVSDVRGTYLRTEPAEIFGDLAGKGKDWVFLDMPYCPAVPEKGTSGLLPRVEKSMFGPPERCFGHIQTSEPMMTLSLDGNLYVPWMIGSHYYCYGFRAFKTLMLDGMAALKPLPRMMETNLPEQVETFFSKIDDHTWMFQLINLTGFNGMSFSAPYPMEGLTVRFINGEPTEVQEMTAEGLRPVPYDKGMVFRLGEGELYKAWLIRA